MWRKTRNAVVALALLAAFGCGDGGGVEELPFYRPGPRPADFPGVEYPRRDGPPGPPASKVWLVGVDGATWERILPLALEYTLLTDYTSFVAVDEVVTAEGELVTQDTPEAFFDHPHNERLQKFLGQVL